MDEICTWEEINSASQVKKKFKKNKKKRRREKEEENKSATQTLYQKRTHTEGPSPLWLFKRECDKCMNDGQVSAFKSGMKAMSCTFRKG